MGRNCNPFCRFAQDNWGVDNPSGGGDCVAMLLHNGKWLDLPCGLQLPFLCEEKLWGGTNLVAEVTALSTRTLSP